MRSRSNKGFTLIEMLIAIGIMVAITSVVVLNRSKAGEGATLKNDADLMSLNIRQAQVNSIAVRETSAGSGNFNVGYGVYFPHLAINSYIVWVDTNGNGVYDGGETLSTGVLSNGELISDLCVLNSVGAEVCNQSNLNMRFLRPNTAPLLYANGVLQSGIQGLRIKITSTSGLLRTVTIYSTGEISVQ
jgi:prepilin-type N-terminal cleavage/methylation domain-containing protein